MKKTSIALCAALFAVSQSVQADPATDALAQKLDALSHEIDALKAQVKQLKAQNEALATQQEAGAAAQPATAATAAPTGVSTQEHADSALGRATLFGYGEIYYDRYDHDAAATQMDLARGVFGIGYRFDDSTRFVSEFEVEHAVASADDEGEFEIEQFYIDHRFADWANLKVGLILIPSGYVNSVHEPPRFLGVERNFVETQIIPSTEREGGLALYGKLQNGFAYDLGLTTSFNLANWDFSGQRGFIAQNGQEAASPLSNIHQELQFAKASQLAQYLALNYDGIPGFNIGATGFTGQVGQKQPNVVGNPRFLLWDVHARYEHGPLHLQSVYARGRFTDTGGLNLANAGTPNPIPASFDGWYVEGGYRVWQHGSLSLVPFARYERFNVGASYANEPIGFGTPALPTETDRTVGFNFYLNPNVVFKADYQQFQVDKAGNRFSLGLGFQF